MEEKKQSTYVDLLAEFVRQAEVTAETLMELHKKRGESKEDATAHSLRDKYAELGDKLKSEQFILTKQDICLISAALISSQKVISKQAEKINGLLSLIGEFIAPKLSQLIKIEDETELNKQFRKAFFVQNSDKSNT